MIDFLGFNLMTEDASGFEFIIREMNISQNSIDKVKITKCENPNCKTAFTKYEQCKSCNRTFCSSCLVNCESCVTKNCKFCIRVLYSKFKDTQICQNC